MYFVKQRILISFFFTVCNTFISKIFLEIDRTKERLADILEDRGLSFLFPLLRIQADLWKQLQTDPSPNSLYRWIKETIDVSQHTVPGFVSALVSWYVSHLDLLPNLVYYFFI